MLTRSTKKTSPSPLVSQAHGPALFQRQQPLLPATHQQKNHTYSAVDSGFHFGGIPILQPKLTIGQPNDKYEQEADRIADQVMQSSGTPFAMSRHKNTVPRDIDTPGTTPAHNTTGQDGLQRLCSRCSGRDQPGKPSRSLSSSPQISPMKNQALSRYKFSDVNDSEPPKESEPEIIQQNDEESSIRKKPASGVGIQSAPGADAVTTTDAVQHAIETSNKYGGTPLSTESRIDMESRFGHDFSNVRVHTEKAAGDISQQINARAFTYGNHVYFAPGEYQPRASSGKRLLAHELTHVVQQGMGKTGGVRAKQIQRTEAETLQHCPAYWKWETPRNVETYNCAGLAHRTYDYKGLNDTVNLLSAGGTACGANKIKHWLWQYDLHIEDHQGTKLTQPSGDFHTVAGMVDPRGNDPTDVYSKNGRRPVYGPGTGPGFKPPAKIQARENNANEKLATDSNGNPIYKVRSNFQTSVVCLNCPRPRK